MVALLALAGAGKLALLRLASVGILAWLLPSDLNLRNLSEAAKIHRKKV